MSFIEDQRVSTAVATSKELNRQRRYDAARREYAKLISPWPAFALETRDLPKALEQIKATAEVWIGFKADVRGQDSQALIARFYERLSRSKAIADVMRCEAINLAAASLGLTYLIWSFSDDQVPRTAAPLGGQLSSEPLIARERANRARILEQASAILRDAGSEEAKAVGEIAGRYRAALSKPPAFGGVVLPHSAKGRPRGSAGDLAEVLDIVWGAVPSRTRYQLIASLAADFYRPTTPEQVRALLKDRWRRFERSRARRKSGRK